MKTPTKWVNMILHAVGVLMLIIPILALTYMAIGDNWRYIINTIGLAVAVILYILLAAILIAIDIK